MRSFWYYRYLYSRLMWTWLLVALAAALLIRFLSGRGDRSPESTSSSDQPPAASDSNDLAPVVLPIEPFIDLHAFSPQDIPDVVESYLEAAQNEGFAEVRLIHGRGKGVQRDRIRSLLARHPSVLDFRDAPPERGGWGATLVQLGRKD